MTTHDLSGERASATSTILNLEENLAKRLAADTLTIRSQRSAKNPKEFESWCRQRDPGSMGWRYKDDGFYHPVK